MIKKEFVGKALCIALAAAFVVVSPGIISNATNGTLGAVFSAGGSGSGSGEGGGSGSGEEGGGSGSGEENNTSSPSTGGSSSGSSSSRSSKSSKSSGGSGGGAGAVATGSKTSFVLAADGARYNTTVQGSYDVKSLTGIAVVTPLSDVKSALGIGTGKDAYVLMRDSLRGPKAMEQVNIAASNMNVTVGPVVDIMLGQKNGDQTVSYTLKANNMITIVMGLPADLASTEFDYAVLRVESGGAVTVLPDLDADPSTLTFNTDASGLFAVLIGPKGCFDGFRAPVVS